MSHASSSWLDRIPFSLLHSTPVSTRSSKQDHLLFSATRTFVSCGRLSKRALSQITNTRREHIPNGTRERSLMQDDWVGEELFV